MDKVHWIKEIDTNMNTIRRLLIKLKVILKFFKVVVSTSLACTSTFIQDFGNGTRPKPVYVDLNPNLKLLMRCRRHLPQEEGTKDR